MGVARVVTDATTRTRLGAALADILDQLYPVDCQTCGIPLGPQAPALCVDQLDGTPPLVTATLHHRACRSPEWRSRDVTAPTRPTLTYRMALLVDTMPFPGQTRAPFVLAVVNPGLERLHLTRRGGRWRPGTVEAFRLLGLVPPGPDSAFDRPVPAAVCRVDAGTLTICIRDSYTWAAATDNAATAARARGGVLLGVTTRLGLDRNPTKAQIAPLVAGREISFGWVPFRPA